jgi:MOSC domain-containing protein YiiM
MVDAVRVVDRSRGAHIMNHNSATGTVVAVSVGKVGTVQHGSRAVRTAFVKRPLEAPAVLGRDGFDGDEHVYEHHGGSDMAALIYSFDHYPAWESELGRRLSVPSFGENLTVIGFGEDAVHLGDVIGIGEAVVQVCQPRTPCSKLAAVFGIRDMAVRVQNTGRTGYLVRVLEEGSVAAGDTVRLIDRQSHGMSVAEAGRIVNVATSDLDAARRVLAIEALGGAVRRTLSARVAAGMAEDAAPRLFGVD